MIVNDNLYVNQGVNSIRKQNISNYKTKDKTVEGNSLNALESQGRAQVNMSFKGKINYEMSDEELQKKKKLFGKNLIPYKMKKLNPILNIGTE